jgi:hypothetical protein
LRENQDNDVRGEVDGSRGDFEIGFLNAFSGYCEIIDAPKWNACEAKGKDRCHEKRELDPDQDNAEPPKDIACSSGNKEARPF